MPVVSLSTNRTLLIEDEGTEVTFTITLDEPPPAGGLNVEFGTGKPFALGDFEVFPPAASFSGIAGFQGFSDNSGATITIVEQTATITFPIFNDNDLPPSDPNATRNDDIGEEQTTFSILPGSGYTIGSDSSVTLTLRDTAVVNANPVADNDSYSTDFDTALTVSAAGGVLDGDMDADGDTLTAAIATQPTNGSITLNSDGSFTYTPDSGFSGDDTFTYTVSDGNGGTDNGSVSITVEPEDSTDVTVDLSTSTDFGGTENAVIEDEGTSVTFSFNLSEPAPSGGLRVFVDSEIAQILNRLDLPAFAFNPQVENIDSGTFNLSFDNSGFALTIDEGATSASVTIQVFDNVEPDTFLPEVFDGLVEATFTLQTDVSAEDQADIGTLGDYVVGDGSTTVLFADTASQLNPDGENVIVSFSITPDIISEADGTALVMNFSVTGDIPEGGVTVNLEGDAARIMQQFTVAQTRFDAETGNIFYRFDNGFAENENGNIVGGVLDRFSLEDGDPSETNSDPAAAGDGFLSDFSFTITEATASITIPVLDDILEEPDQTFTYALVDGDGYTVDETANRGTFTVTDGVTPTTSPTVGVTATPTTLIESEQTVVEVTFTTEGEIPAEGLVVQLSGPPRAIAEFDVNATNPRLSEDETVVEGVVVTGGNIVGTDEVAGSLFLRITDPTATVTVPVFQDDVAEGTEVLPFTLLDGEDYEVDSDTSSVEVTIEDGATMDLPIVSFNITPDVVAEDSDDPSFTFTITVEGEIPEEGITTIWGGTFLNQPPRLFDNNIPVPFLPDGSVEFGGPVFDDDGNLTGFTATIFEPVITANPFIFDDIIEEEPIDLVFSLLPGDSYIVGQGDAPVTIIDGDSVIPGSGPTVSLSVDNTELEEGDELTVSFMVDGDIPEGGLPIFVDGPAASLSEFNIFGDDGIDPATDLVGISGFPEADGDAGGFLVILTENQASITLSVFDDGPTEGPESLTFELANGEQYEAAPDASIVDLTIDDDGEDAVFEVESGVTSVFLDFPLLGEVAGLTLVGADSDAQSFSDDFQVGFPITDATDFRFAPAPFTPVGGTIEHSGTITLGLGDAEVTIGDFSIGFDADRVSDTASGFFVADTLDDPLGLEVLFDLSAPGTASVSNNELEISDADLLLSPELAGALGLDDLAGTDVGDARIDATVALIDDAFDSMLIGTSGEDRLIGTKGDDLFDGGLGQDKYIGGKGADTFVIRPGEGLDTIRDFRLWQGDRIALGGGLTFSDLTISRFGRDGARLSFEGEDLAIVQANRFGAINESAFTVI